MFTRKEGDPIKLEKLKKKKENVIQGVKDIKIKIFLLTNKKLYYL